MGETIEHAREGIEHAHHAQVHEGNKSARWIAMLTAVLAAALAIFELGARSNMTEYLTRHIALSDDYAYYQEKHVRLTVEQTTEAVLQSLPDAAKPAIQARIDQARRDEARLQDNPQDGQGMKQLLDKAAEEKQARDHAAHLTHRLEAVVGGLQIAIVLASASVVTRVHVMAWVSAALGAALVAYGALLWTGAA